MRILFPLIAVLLPLPALGADETYHVEVPLAKSKKKSDRAVEPLDKVALHLWVPGDVKVLRGVVFNPFNDKQVEQKHWQEACRLWGFGIVGANYFGVDGKEFADIYRKGLAQLAADLKRPELANVPACLIGMSAGAGMCAKLAEQMPDRVIAVAAVCLEVGPTTKGDNLIPFLTVFGEKDGKQMEILTEKLPKARREMSAEWAIAVQWGRRHEWAKANDLVMPFMDACIRERYPREADPLREVVHPDVIDPQNGEGADQRTWTEPVPQGISLPGLAWADDVGWLPDRFTARVWKAFVTKEPALAIQEPARFGDGKPFVPVPAGKPVKVVLTGTKTAKHIKLFDGDRELASAANADGADTLTIELKELKPGVHSLIAASVEGKRVLGYSRPTTVIVPK